jgi:hypothetical protein
MITDGQIQPSPETESPATWPGDGPPAFARTSGRSQNTLGLRLLLVFAGYMGGFVSGAGLVAIIWLATAGINKPSPRNSPEALLSAPRSHRQFVSKSAPILKVALSAADLAFGEKQVERMVNDRPEMKRYVGKEDAVWQFCARGFAGETCGKHVNWDSGLPAGTYRAQHRGPYRGENGAIRIREIYADGHMKGEPLPCEELWAGAIFELENIRNTLAFDDLYKRAFNRGIGREEFIRESTRLEHAALLRAAKDYVKLWKAMADDKSIPTSGHYWNTHIPADYDKWISKYNDPNGYPWDSIGKYYDEEVVPYLRSR